MMRKFFKFLAVAALALLPEMAFAGVHVSVAGSADSAACGAYGTPCNLATAMTMLRSAAGRDTAYFTDGTYDAYPVPNNSGNDTTSRIVMIRRGWAEKVNAPLGDTLVKFVATSGNLHRRNVEYHHMTFQGRTFMYQPGTVLDTMGVYGVLMRAMRFRGNTEFAHLKYTWHDSCHVDTLFDNAETTHFWLTTQPVGHLVPTGYRTNLHMLRPKFTYCVFNTNTGRKEPGDNDKWLITFGAGAGPDTTLPLPGGGEIKYPPLEYIPRYPVFIGNKWYITYNKLAAVGVVRGLYAFGLYNPSFSRDEFYFADHTPSTYGTEGRDQMFRFRDRIIGVSMQNCKFQSRGRACNFAFNSDGGPNLVDGQIIRYNEFDMQTLTQGDQQCAIEWTNTLRNVTFDHNIVKSLRGGIAFVSVNGVWDSLTHNTIYAGTLDHKALSMDQGDQYAAWDPNTVLTITHNIYYSPYTGSVGFQDNGVRIAKVDGRTYEIDWNLHFYKADPNNEVGVEDCNNPGDCNYDPVTLAQACQRYGLECHSRRGTAMFRDSSFANWNFRPTYNGAHKFGLSGGYVGAVWYGSHYTFRVLAAPDDIAVNYHDVRYNGTQYVGGRMIPTGSVETDPYTWPAAPDSIVRLVQGCFTADSTRLAAPAYTDTVGKTLDGAVSSLYAVRASVNAPAGSDYAVMYTLDDVPYVVTPLSAVPVWYTSAFAPTYYGLPWHWGWVGSNMNPFSWFKTVYRYTAVPTSPFLYGVYVHEMKTDFYGSKW